MTLPPLPRFPVDFPLGPKQIERLLYQIPRSATYQTGGLADICQALLLDRAAQLVGVENVRWVAALNRWVIEELPAVRWDATLNRWVIGESSALLNSESKSG